MRICPQKRALVVEYTSSLTAYRREVSEHSTMVQAGLKAELLTLAKMRVKQSREKCDQARKSYLDHVREHDCDNVRGKAEGG